MSTVHAKFEFVTHRSMLRLLVFKLLTSILYDTVMSLNSLFVTEICLSWLLLSESDNCLPKTLKHYQWSGSGLTVSNANILNCTFWSVEYAVIFLMNCTIWSSCRVLYNFVATKCNFCWMFQHSFTIRLHCFKLSWHPSLTANGNELEFHMFEC